MSTVFTKSLLMQAAQQGKAHIEFERVIDELPDAKLIRINVLGKTILLVADPTAAEEVLRRNKFVPKLLRAYEGFYFLVRLIHLISVTLCSTTSKRLIHDA